MEITPRTRSSARLKRAPTPKLSERKKKLFEDNEKLMFDKVPYVRLERIIVEENEDSDLGPMSPLQFSSSPSTFNQIHQLSRSDKGDRTDFTNIMDELTMDRNYSMKKLSINFAQKLDEIGNDDDDDDNERSTPIEEDVVGPLCTSMKKLNSTIETPSSDPIQLEENYEQQMKTPSETSLNNKTDSMQLIRGISFRKSLIFDTGLTPHDDHQSNSTNATMNKSNENDTNERPKAKTSLTFNEPTISAKSFYGKPIEESFETLSKSMKMTSHAFAAAISAKSKKKSTKSKSLAKRMKAQAPSLWRFSGKNKFHHHNKNKRHSINKPKITNNKPKIPNNNNVQIVEVEVHPPPNGVQSSSLNDEHQFTSNIEQNLRLQKILKDQTNTLNASHEIDWTGTLKNGAAVVQSMNNDLVAPNFGDSDDDDDGAENQDPTKHTFIEFPTNDNDQNESTVSTANEPMNRKFFKSTSNSSAKKYRIMGRLSATVKRGGDLKLEPPPKRKKRKPQEDKVILHTEISSIIDRLSSPSKNAAQTETNTNPSTSIVHEEQMQIVGVDSVDKYRQMIPYNTTDPEKISQQESIIELLITNGICNDETFKIFIAEPDAHKDEASKILDSLYCVNTMIPEPETYDNEMPTNEWIENIQTAPILITNNDTEMITSTECTEISNVSTNSSMEQTFYPIFNKNFNAQTQKLNNQKTEFTSLQKTTEKWIPNGLHQYQIDAGQKAFGMKKCATCEMEYSVHEPEDELLHMKYHNGVNILTFKGWTNERIVTEIPDWGIDGRIIFVCETDSKAKKERIKEILGLVDRDLGFAARQELKPKTLVYLAIAKQQIVGVLVAQPLECAHRLKTENGIDFTSIETYPAKCGISRIWVAAPYRRHKIASKLITSMRGHFRFGCFLTFDEIAFSSPTEDGKRFAASLAQRSDFLVFEN